MLLISYLGAKINIHSFQSRFEQKVFNDQNRSILYKGSVYFKSPDRIRWEYLSPNRKSIYILGQKAVIIDPELEQVLIRYVKTQDILTSLNSAKKISNNHYLAKIGKKNYHIYMKDNVLKKIIYKDDMGNRVEVLFLNPKQNEKLDDKVFEYRIDPEWDVIVK